MKKTISRILPVLYGFHFVLVLDLRKSDVLHDFAFRFLFSLGDFSVLSPDLVDGHEVSWLGLVSCTLDFLTHRNFSFGLCVRSGLLLRRSSRTRICALVAVAAGRSSLFDSAWMFLARIGQSPKFNFLHFSVLSSLAVAPLVCSAWKSSWCRPDFLIVVPTVLSGSRPSAAPQFSVLLPRLQIRAQAISVSL
jgi:hypothetical protein